MKKILSKIVFWFLGRGFQVCAQKDSRVKEEVSSFKENMVVVLKICPLGPCMVLKKQQGKFKYIGSNEEKGDLAIYFKNINSAVNVLTGSESISMAYAEHRFLVKGEISKAMTLVRCLNILEGYLFPSFITSKIIQGKIEKQVSSFSIYTSILFCR